MIKATFAGYNFVHHNGIRVDRPNGTKSLLFLYFKTPVDVLVNSEMVHIAEPTFLIYDKGVPQFYISESGPYCNDFLHFTDDNIYDLLKELNIPLNTLLKIHNAQEISSYFKDISREMWQTGKCHDNIIDMKIRTLLYKFSDMLYDERTYPDKLNRYRQSFTKIRNKIYDFNNFETGKSVNDFAQTLNISTSYFQHIYKQLFDVSITQDLIRSRIEYACYLLNDNFDSISNIASKCGYENKEHFTRQFKEVIGMTPKQYRTSH